MTTRKPKAAHAKKAGTARSQPNNVMTVETAKDETPEFATARAILDPSFRHAVTAAQVNKALFGSLEGGPGISDYADAFVAKGEAAAKGDYYFVCRMLAAQAVTLDGIFTETARRMALNMGEQLTATEIYARIAMKAQAQSRATLEALANLLRPREQTVKHVHVNQGGQAVVADEFHQHDRGVANGKTVKQSHAAEAADEQPALPSPDPERDRVPIPSRQRQAALQNARRDEPRSSPGQS